MAEVSTTQASGGRSGDALVSSRPAQSSTSERVARSQPLQTATHPGAAPILDSVVSPNETTQQATKLTARLNASAVSEKERKELLAERTKLIRKSLTEKLTRKEEIRLEYVRWSLDRIEDARHGQAMDRLEAQIDEFHKLADRLLGLRDNLDGLTRNKKRR